MYLCFMLLIVQIAYKEQDIANEGHLADCLSLGPSFAALLKLNASPPVGVDLPEEPGDIEKLIWSSLHLTKLKSDAPNAPHSDR